MLFQTLDDKGNCAGFYANGELNLEELPQDHHTATWDYSVHLTGRDVEYARLYCEGMSLSQACPPEYQQHWSELSARLLAYFRSFSEAKVNLEEHCFYKLVPERFLLEFFDAKNEITKHILDTKQKPRNYNFLVELSEVVADMAQRDLFLDRNVLKPRLASKRVRDFWKKIDTHKKIQYNIFGTKTGRLTTKKSSFPILTLDSTFRSVIKPQNDWLVELDFNAAELRTLLSLAGKEQPKEDIHDWNMKTVLKRAKSREDAKKKVFAWLYNSKSANAALDAIYDRDAVRQKYFNGSQVTTFFHRTIPADEHHALNYIIQSTTSDLFLRRMCEVFNFLRDKQSHIAFSVHDSLVLDIKHDERKYLKEIVEIFGNTELGAFKVNVKAGKDYGNMQEVK